MKKGFNETFSYKLIYVFGIADKAHEGLLKVGEASINQVNDLSKLTDNSDPLNEAAILRINDYTRTAGINYQLFHTTLAITNKNFAFRDNDVHNVLKRSNIEQPKENLNGATEWYRCDLETVKKL